MDQVSRHDAADTNFSWRAGVCLFLAVLFFYNPFFTIYGSSAGLNVQHPLSFRGTVASSELRRSIIQKTVPNLRAPEEAVLAVVPLPDVLLLDANSSQEERLISEREAASESLWFRPPPVL